jgi:two-component system sensor histidine kinase KdpD
VRWRNYVAAAVSVFAVVSVLRLASVEAAGVAAPLLLLDIVVVARLWGIGSALLAAALAAAAYSYYFLPPAGFAIADPDDWIAFVTFIVTAVVAGELASRAERRAAEAEAGRREIERLYQELQTAFDRASEAEAARRNEQLKAALLEALTHNLRTPLTSIKASATALIGAQTWGGASSLSREGQGELLQVIDEESDRLNRFVEGLSNSEEAELAQPNHVRAIRLEQVVRTAVVRAETLTRDHHVSVALDDDLPPVLADPASLTEVVYILLDNASKYAPAGTTISIRAMRPGTDADHYVRISVADEGPGIPPELHERVFDKFFRVPARESHDRRRGGIGLGLPIARRLIEAQAGRIWIEPAVPGNGTTIAIALPVSTEVEEREVSAAAEAAAE